MKAVIVLYLIYILHSCTARGLHELQSNDSLSIDPDEFEQPVAVCRLAAYANALACTVDGLDTDDLGYEIKCMSDVVLDYLNCTDSNVGDLDSLSGLVETSFRSDGLTKAPGVDIRCIVDNVLDLIKCVVAGESIPPAPFIWDWMVLVKCAVSNVPKYIKCISII